MVVDKELSDIELAILNCVAEGYTMKQTGDIIGRSSRTVENKIQKMIRELGAKNSTNLVKIAFENNYLTSLVVTPKLLQQAQKDLRKKETELIQVKLFLRKVKQSIDYTLQILNSN